MNSIITGVFARKRTPGHIVKPTPPEAPVRTDDADRIRRINALAEEILLIRVLSGAQPETQGGREKEARLALLLARAMVDEQDRAATAQEGD